MVLKDKGKSRLKSDGPIHSTRKETNSAPPSKGSINSPEGSNVKVLVRVRPKVARESELNSTVIVEMSGNTTILHNPSPKEFSSPSKSKKIDEFNDRTFNFDHSLWSVDPNDKNFKSQDNTYQVIGKEILDHTLSGYNTCIFAYGQTGSGKSYTMMGTKEEPGIIPRTCRDIFTEKSKLEKNIKIQIKVSYFEIYNEQVSDLLSGDKNLRIRENPETGPYVEQLTECAINDYDDFLKFMDMGNQRRTVAATKMNDKSSRSHAVFTIGIRMTEFNINEDLVKETNCTLRLIDLAGSERVNSTGATGIRFKEGSNINKSLTTLGRVISALSDGQKPPYRDSTLTWILKESLGGNSKTAMIACISPCDYDETLSTLRYATMAKKVKLIARINVDEITNGQHAEELERMRGQIAELTSSLNEVKEQDVLINQIKNMSRFFENRLVDQTNLYELVKSRLLESEKYQHVYYKDLQSILGTILLDQTYSRKFQELNNELYALQKHSEKISTDFKQELEIYAP